ncbi:MAG TPA: DoxX family protein [Actinocatenispora sp.]
MNTGMKPVRSLAHALLSSVFVTGAAHTLMRPERAAKATTGLSDRLTEATERVAPWLPTGPVAVVRMNAAVQLTGGVLLATGRLPRLAALTLAASLVPTTVVGHAFWRIEDPAQRAEQRNHFLKNLSLIGGLLVTAVDTQGRPGLSWRASHATERAAKKVGEVRRDATHKLTHH